MKARDIFGIILRIVALYLFLWGAWNTIAGLRYLPSALFGALSGRDDGANFLGWFVYGVPALLMGFLMFAYAESLVRFTYQEKSPSSLSQSSNRAEGTLSGDI